jgi:hypothetical protein
MTKQIVKLTGGSPLLDLTSHGRSGPGGAGRLSPAQIEQISRTVRGVPEVMVKITGGGQSPHAVAAHIQYIDRRGELQIEMDDGEQVRGRDTGKNLAVDWDLDIDAAESRSPYRGRPGRKPAKLVHNVVFSMPAGTPPKKVAAAVRNFAREEFAFKHRYAFVLHTDEDHPHVHFILKAVDENGVRLNIKKATLRHWRSEFARNLRGLGVEANATERAVRGESRKAKKDGIYRARLRGDSSFVRAQVMAVAEELRKGGLAIEAGKRTMLRTRSEVERGWQAVADLLDRNGDPTLACDVWQFVGRLLPVRTEKEMIARGVLQRVRDAGIRKQELNISR